MSFGRPLVLLALLGLPLLVWRLYAQRTARARAAQAFSMPALLPSVAPVRPGFRRQAPGAVLILALAALILAAARPQRSVAVPLTDGAVMLADDVSSSMAATDVAPSRLGAAQSAAARFIAAAPAPIRVGALVFSARPVVLQSPSVDHALARAALAQPLRAAGHTAIGAAIEAALASLSGLRTSSGRRPPGAIVLLSDGTSTTGTDPITAAQAAAAQHVPIFTVSLGTSRGTISVRHGARFSQVPVPVDGSELAQVAQRSGGRAFRAADAAGLRTVYAHLAAQLGHRQIRREVSAPVAGAGLGLLVLGSILSLGWFGRLASL